MKFLYCFLIFLLLTGFIQAQTPLIDSLETALASSKIANERIDLLCKLSKQYAYTDIKKGEAYAVAAEKLAVASNNFKLQARALNLRGNAYLASGEFDQGLRVHLKALQISQRYGDTLTVIASMNSVGSMYFKMHQPDRAMNYYTISLPLARKIGDKLGESNAYNSIGNVYEAKGEFKKGLIYFKKAAALQEKLNDKNRLAISLLNIGYIHLNMPHPEQGLPYLFRSLELDRQIGNEIIPVTTLKCIAEIYKATNHPAEALKYGKQAYALALKVKSEKNIVATARLLKEIYISRGNFEKALSFQTILDAHEAALDLHNQKTLAAELTAKYESEKKALENKRLKALAAKQEQEIRTKNTELVFSIVVTFFTLFGLMQLIQSRRRIKKFNRKLKEQHIQIVNREQQLQKQAETLKSQNLLLEKNSIFRNKVFSIISHDLRAPFSSIKNLVDLQQDKTFTPEEVNFIFTHLRRSLGNSMDMLNNLLIWSKAQLEYSKVNLEPTNIQAIAADNIHFISFQAQEKKITIQNEVAEDIIIFTDRERLNFILRNILQNAIKFSFPEGVITLGAKITATSLVLTVADNGKGISPRNLEKLFTQERFTTLGTQQEKGTGLGLKFCFELAESIKGAIQVESTEGKGSIFSLVLPFTNEPVKTENALVAKEKNTSGLPTAF